MRQIFTAITFLLVLLAPTFWAARISGVFVERKKKKLPPKKQPQRVDGTATLLGQAVTAEPLAEENPYERRA